MDRRQAHDALIRLLRPKLMPMGFSRKDNDWFRHDRVFLQMLEITAWDDFVTVRLGAVCRSLTKSTHPTLRQSHIRVGAGSIISVDYDWQTCRSFRTWTALGDGRLATFINLLERYVIPVLDQWRSIESIRGFLATPLADKCIVDPELLRIVEPSVH